MTKRIRDVRVWDKKRTVYPRITRKRTFGDVLGASHPTDIDHGLLSEYIPSCTYQSINFRAAGCAARGLRSIYSNVRISLLPIA